MKGNQSKELVFQKIKEIFPKAFMQDSKVMRIPLDEDGVPVEIKVTLTAAKDILGDGEVESAFTLTKKPTNSPAVEKDFINEPNQVTAEPTEEEKQHIVDLLDSLNL